MGDAWDDGADAGECVGAEAALRRDLVEGGDGVFSRGGGVLARGSAEEGGAMVRHGVWVSSISPKFMKSEFILSAIMGLTSPAPLLDFRDFTMVTQARRTRDCVELLMRETTGMRSTLHVHLE